MKTIDYVYRFDPQNPSVKVPPPDADAARRSLEDGNRMFSRWMEDCRTGELSPGEPRYIVQCNGLEAGLNRGQGQMPKQVPFAVVVGCSDARVPMEMLFGQGFNDLFVIRVAGNVMGDVCQGSIDFALTALSASVKVVVVLGHSGCGAVTGAVDAYLNPMKHWSRTNSPSLRSILLRIFVAVRESANALEEVWGPKAREMPNYRNALMGTAVGLNAAMTAFVIRQEVERMAKWEIDVIYGVFNLHSNQVSMPPDPDAPTSDENVHLAHAPSSPREFRVLAMQMAEMWKARGGEKESVAASPAAQGESVEG
jgi:carbonic anhydrase